jgi:hypothetical protein
MTRAADINSLNMCFRSTYMTRAADQLTQRVLQASALNTCFRSTYTTRAAGHLTNHMLQRPGPEPDLMHGLSIVGSNL